MICSFLVRILDISVQEQRHFSTKSVLRLVILVAFSVDHLWVKPMLAVGHVMRRSLFARVQKGSPGPLRLQMSPIFTEVRGRDVFGGCSSTFICEKKSIMSLS